MNIPRPTEWNGQAIRAPILPPRVPAQLEQKASPHDSVTDLEVGKPSPPPEPATRFSFRAYLETTRRCPRVSNEADEIYYCHVSSTASIPTLAAWFLMITLVPWVTLLTAVYAPLRDRLEEFDVIVPLAIFTLCGVSASLVFFYRFVADKWVQDTCAAPLIEGPEGVAGKTLDSTAVVLRGMMQQLRERHATHPNDKAYALYGILKTVQVDKLAPVDYSQPYATVYHRLYSSLLSWDASLVCLLLDANGEGGSLSTDAPSWVPDWSMPCRNTWLDPSYVYASRATSASGSAPPRAAVADRRLTVTGILYDACTVSFPSFTAVDKAEITPGLDPASPAGQTILALHTWIARACRDIRVDSALDSTPKAIMTVLMGGKLGDVQDEAARQTEEQEFSEWYRVFSDACAAGARGDDAAVVAAAAAALAANERARGYFVQCCEKLAGKRGLFLTAKRYIGTGPVAMMGSESGGEGDVIALVVGAATPLVLRSRGNGEYSVVGPALIPGVMEGEAWEREGGEKVAQDIVLV